MGSSTRQKLQESFVIAEMKAQLVISSLLGVFASTILARNGQAEQLAHALHRPRSHQGHLGKRPSTHEAFHERDTGEKAEQSSSRFLNNSTAKFAVNGTAIPDVDFDVGESYAGLLPISDDPNEIDNLFFWFFPTVNKKAKCKKEIVIWLNGGPGCSSLLGFLEENGPFVLLPGTQSPQPNPWGWQLLSNIVWIDQPVSVGYSTGEPSITNEDELAEQFLGFWKNFIKTFSMQGWKVYVAAESYGGMYGPFISSHMLNSNDTEHNNLQGMLIYDGLIADSTVQSNIPVAAFMNQHYELMPLGDSARQKIDELSDRCGYDRYHKQYLQYPPEGPAPSLPPSVTLAPNGTLIYDEECNSIFSLLEDSAALLNPCLNLYNIQDHCPVVSSLLNGRAYFDRIDVKKALHTSLNHTWTACVNGVFNSTSGNDESDPPDRYELPNVIDKTNNVIIAHGSKDFILPLNGVLLGLQNMTWGGMLGFQTRPTDPFYVPLYGYDPFGSFAPFYGINLPAGAGVLGTTIHERGLTLVVTQLAGHQGPEYSSAGAFRHLEKLLGRVDSLSDTTPFTLPQLKNIAQFNGSLGKGTVIIPCFGRGC